MKQAAGMLKWLSTWSLPVTCSTTALRHQCQGPNLSRKKIERQNSTWNEENAMYLKFLVHWLHVQASFYHLHLQCNTNEVPDIQKLYSVTIGDSLPREYATQKFMTNQISICINYSHSLINRYKTSLCYYINLRRESKRE